MAAFARLRQGVLLPRLVAGAVLLVAWQALAMSGLLFRDVIPTVQALVVGLVRVFASPDFYTNLAVTCAEVVAAMVAGGLAGGVTFRFLAVPLSEQQLKDVIQLQGGP